LGIDFSKNLKMPLIGQLTVFAIIAINIHN
jgi:uncharacterized membrane protein